MRAGIIGDPAVGFNERDQFWVGHTDWEYRAVVYPNLKLLEHQQIDLVCDGLDTIASISIGGVPAADAANMFHPHRFDITHVIARARARANLLDLRIRFRSPVAHIRSEEARLGSRPVNGDWDPYIFIRKAACNFGWDWGPKVPTVGIWKSIRLEAWSHARIVNVRPLVTRADAGRAEVEVHVDIQHARTASTPSPLAPDPAPLSLDAVLRPPKGRLTPALRVSQSTTTEQHAILRFTVPRPARWWPRGYGKQPLYSLRVNLRSALHPRRTLGTFQSRLGLRTVRLNTEPDTAGSRFQLEINGRPIFCKGANWIPDDLFPARVTPSRLRRRVQQAALANMNMLRVWGGGYYEHDAFYAACDRAGILVWQDFMFACAMYPEEQPYPQLIEAEARHQVARLSSHPSVVLWCGGNECVWGWQRWGWKQRLSPGQTWGRNYYIDMLPMVLRELDPTRPYWPNSPWSGSLDHDVLDEHHGDRHTWDAAFEDYRNTRPRFLSEVGHQAPATLRTLRGAIAPAGLAINSPELQHRQRATGGNAAMYDAHFARHALAPHSFLDWHRAAQELQSRAMTIACNWSIDKSPGCAGILIWQLNDCWPALSWSLIDSAGRPKPAYFAVQKAFARRIPRHRG